MADNRVDKIVEKFDPDFRFLLDFDPAFEEWRGYAAEWLKEQERGKIGKRAALARFFVSYLHSQQLEKCPKALLVTGFSIPSLWKALNLDSIGLGTAKSVHDSISDFIEWVLMTKYAKANSEGFLVVPSDLCNPFPRMQLKFSGKSSDIEFRYLLSLDARMEDWRTLASDWLGFQRLGINAKKLALDRFFTRYLLLHDLERNPYNFLRLDYKKPAFIDSIVATKQKGNVLNGKASVAADDIAFNNSIHDFLAWLLTEKLSVEDDKGHRVVPYEYHNPFPRLRKSGKGQAETLKSPLAYCYIRELRTMLAQGANFCDWVWAQQAMEGGNNGGDWFVVPPSLINHDDPDCVWRMRRRPSNYPLEIFELWSPVRAVALYIKLELPLRTHQVRMLDSGESDTWRYDSGKWLRNNSLLAKGSESRPSQRGVFHRSSNETGTGLYINTNKTADIEKGEQRKGYVIPWTHEPALYWLEKLRNWQEQYNPIVNATLWSDLERKHFGQTPPSSAVLEERGACCFLFRDAAARDGLNCAKPIINNALSRFWYLLLSELEKRCEAFDDGSVVHFVNPDSRTVTHYPLHALRVSLITAYALDGGVPFPILSKLIAGHARLIMTLYYTKVGKAHVTEVMQEAEKRIFESNAISYRRFLMEKTYQEIEERFAFNSSDALKAVSPQKSAAGLLFEDKGICPVGGSLCDIGGEILKDSKADPSQNIYSPVSGYPQERNCIRCRFFLTGPAFLPGLQAHANSISYRATKCSERYVRFEQQVKTLEDLRLLCEERGSLFTQHQELERLNRYYEEEAEKANKLLTDFQGVVRLIDRCIGIANSADKDGVRLIATGSLSDIKYALYQTESEMHQLEVICEDAVIYPEINAGKATLRRSQILDAMLQMNGKAPIFFRLNQEQQLCIGNELMKLILARTGNFRDAVEFAEGKRLLTELGLLDEAIGLIEEKTAGMPFRQVIDAARSGILLTAVAQEDGHEP